MKTIYRITYRGMWLGGIAIVAANTKEEAILLVQSDPNTIDFNNITIEPLPEIEDSRVLYNDNGDY